MPRETAIAQWLAVDDLTMNPPELPERSIQEGRAAALDIVSAMTTLLDHARTTPIAALKRGGVGTRERKRLVTVEHA